MSQNRDKTFHEQARLSAQSAHRIVEETQIIRLSIEDQRAFAAAILDPPAPNAALRRAAAAHRELIRA